VTQLAGLVRARQPPPATDHAYSTFRENPEAILHLQQQAAVELAKQYGVFRTGNLPVVRIQRLFEISNFVSDARHPAQATSCYKAIRSLDLFATSYDVLTALFDPREWISTERIVNVNFDGRLKNMAVFGAGEGFSMPGGVNFLSARTW
jgi:hypothetical protein